MSSSIFSANAALVVSVHCQDGWQDEAVPDRIPTRAILNVAVVCLEQRIQEDTKLHTEWKIQAESN